MSAQAETLAANPLPSLAHGQNEESADSLLQIRDLKKRFSLRGFSRPATFQRRQTGSPSRACPRD